ncbi:MAG: pilus assembly protein N-terminal domain-containing protein [Fuerstiella sp.]|nr:pilus assembly protein N-terminal domain-containing protein [Fuerstiella sp.]
MPTLKSLISAAFAAIILMGLSNSLHAQESRTSPVYRLQRGENQLNIYQRFTTLLEHTARIKSVLDFDAEIIEVKVVQGNPKQVRIFALDTGVTTVTICDEFDEYFQVEVQVEGDVRHLQSYIRRDFPDDDVRATEIKGAVKLTGWVTQPSHITQIVEIAEQFYGTVINHMKVGGAQQVQLRCDILEVQRSKVRNFGMNFQFLRSDGYLISTPGPITPISTLTATSAGPVSTLTGFADSTLSFGFIRNNSIFQGFVQALKIEGLLKIHATPIVTTLNGQPATLLNGGETPVIVPAGLGTTAIEFKEFGVLLESVPHILGNGRLRMQVQTEVSERDFSNAVTVSGVTVPAFTVRRASTEVEMNFGETMVLAGLISRRNDATTAKIPLLGEVPWIGAAFGRKRYTEAETELIILITPEHTAPLSAEQIPSGGPGKFTDNVTDRELYFHNLLEVPKYGNECHNCTTCLEQGSCGEHPNGCSGCEDDGGHEKLEPGSSDTSNRGGYTTNSGKAFLRPATYSSRHSNNKPASDLRSSGLIVPESQSIQ